MVLAAPKQSFLAAVLATPKRAFLATGVAIQRRRSARRDCSDIIRRTGGSSRRHALSNPGNAAHERTPKNASVVPIFGVSIGVEYRKGPFGVFGSVERIPASICLCWAVNDCPTLAKAVA